MIPYRWLAGASAVLMLLAAIWWHGNRAGAREVQAKWDAETAQRVEQAREDAVNARKASVNYQATLVKLNARSVNLKMELVNALAKPVNSCAPTVGAFVLPAAAIGVLRDAGADPSP